MNNVLSTIAEQLNAIPGFEVSHEADRDCLSLRVSRRTIPLRVVVRNSGYPRDVRNAVWQVQSTLDRQEHILLSAPTISRGSREWLQSQGISYIDSTGHIFISADGVYVLRDEIDPRRRDGAAGVKIHNRETNIFHGRATRVLHSLLHHPARSWHVTELAAEAGVAPGTALKVCENLEKMLFMEREGRGPQSLRRLTEPGKLLGAWAGEHKLTDYSIDRCYRWLSDIDDLAREIGHALEAQRELYAATLSLGAMHRAPYLTQTDQMALLIPQTVDVSQLMSGAKLKFVDDGANVILLRAKDGASLMYRQEADGLWIASDVQLYLDLNASPGRGKEQAEHLRRERLSF